MLVDEQLPRDQARARAAGLVEVRDHLQHLLHSNLVHLPLRPNLPTLWPPQTRQPVQPGGLALSAVGARVRPAPPIGGPVLVAVAHFRRPRCLSRSLTLLR